MAEFIRRVKSFAIRFMYREKLRQQACHEHPLSKHLWPGWWVSAKHLWRNEREYDGSFLYEDGVRKK